ncbi:MAG: hypothetical protein DRQ88_10540 [Epsilonproteobacteria bacterium]|nr:MAG: hypothetical protein DRQ88_10540 [Campylobacterota bacterium]RLA65630.1 MAG: hypothetical protein DRQ89_01145 [Campylobacterota bacterium]
MKKLILTIFFLIGPLALFAEDAKFTSLGDFVHQEMSSQANYVEDYDYKGANISDINDSFFYMNFISLKVEGIVGLAVPFFASFELRPNIVFRWKRKLPEGYVGYKPATK